MRSIWPHEDLVGTLWHPSLHSPNDFGQSGQDPGRGEKGHLAQKEAYLSAQVPGNWECAARLYARTWCKPDIHISFPNADRTLLSVKNISLSGKGQDGPVEETHANASLEELLGADSQQDMVDYRIYENMLDEEPPESTNNQEQIDFESMYE